MFAVRTALTEAQGWDMLCGWLSQSAAQAGLPEGRLAEGRLAEAFQVLQSG
jgi:hypothetical protein